MLAGQLLSIAQDMIDDYNRHDVINVLNTAVHLAANRPTMNDTQYKNAVDEIRAAAQSMLDGTILRTYPIELKRALQQSTYSQSLTDSVAKTLIVAFGNKRKEAAISSPEMGMYLHESQQFVTKMRYLVEAADALGVKTYDTPTGYVALEVKFPDIVYSRALKGLPPKIDHLADLLSVVEEIKTGARTQHKILWVSTTDLVISIPLEAGVLMAVLFYYEKLLIIAEKHLNIIKLLRDLRKMGAGEHTEIAVNLEKTIDHALQEAVNETAGSLGKSRDMARVNELRNELSKASKAIIPDLAAGMRFDANARDQRNLMEAADEEDVKGASSSLIARRDMEMKLDVQLGSFADEEIKLLTSEPPVNIKL